MSNKKREQKYADLLREAEALRTRMDAEKERMGADFGAALDDGTAALLGNLTDADRRRVMALMQAHAKDFVEQVKAENDARRQARNRARETAQGED